MVFRKSCLFYFAIILGKYELFTLKKYRLLSKAIILRLLMLIISTKPITKSESSFTDCLEIILNMSVFITKIINFLLCKMMSELHVIARMRTLEILQLNISDLHCHTT